MTDKITLNTLATFDPSMITSINTNSSILTAAIDNTLSLNGTSPNQMNAPLDMNSNQIINLPAPSSLSSPVRLSDVTSTGIPIILPNVGFFVFKTTVNFNVANTDTPLVLSLPSGFTRYRLNGVFITGASASISTATVGVFTGTGGTGTTLVTNSAVTVTSSSEDTNNNMQSLTVNNIGTQSHNQTTLQIRVGTAQGSAATAMVSFYIQPVS